MSRTVTPQPTTKTPASANTCVPTELIAKRAFEKWCKRGQPAGTDKQDWYEAEKELRGELARASTPGQRR